MYKPSTLEKAISNAMIKMDILTISDLKPRIISNALNIIYEECSSPAFSGMECGQPFIVIDSRLPIPMQREQFFHELCHVLRHEGNQKQMAKQFRELQEWDAHLFTQYALIPYHMLDFSRDYTIDSLIEEFQVPYHIAKKRAYEISYKWDEVPNITRKPQRLEPIDFNKYSKETQKVLKQLGVMHA